MAIIGVTKWPVITIITNHRHGTSTVARCRITARKSRPTRRKESCPTRPSRLSTLSGRTLRSCWGQSVFLYSTSSSAWIWLCCLFPCVSEMYHHDLSGPPTHHRESSLQCCNHVPVCLLLLLWFRVLLWKRVWLRQFRERTRFLNASENVHRSRRTKKVRAQTFYPCPPPSESEHHHHRYGGSLSTPSSSTDSSSSSGSSDNDTDFDDDAFSIDSSGYINTLVRDETVSVCLPQFMICIRDGEMSCLWNGLQMVCLATAWIARIVLLRAELVLLDLLIQRAFVCQHLGLLQSFTFTAAVALCLVWANTDGEEVVGESTATM